MTPTTSALIAALNHALNLAMADDDLDVIQVLNHCYVEDGRVFRVRYKTAPWDVSSDWTDDRLRAAEQRAMTFLGII